TTASGIRVDRFSAGILTAVALNTTSATPASKLRSGGTLPAQVRPDLCQANQLHEAHRLVASRAEQPAHALPARLRARTAGVVVIHHEECPQRANSGAAILWQATAAGAKAVLSFGQLVVLVYRDVVLGAKMPVAAHPETIRLVLVLVPALLAVGIPARLAVAVEAAPRPNVLVVFAARFGNSARRTAFHMRILASS